MYTNTIKIKDLHFEPVIGVYDAERKGRQDIYVDITITHTRASVEDTLDTTLDYDHVVKSIDAYVRSNKPYLIETFANDIADICMGIETVTSVRIKVTKPEALKNGVVSVVVKKPKEKD